MDGHDFGRHLGPVESERAQALNGIDPRVHPTLSKGAICKTDPRELCQARERQTLSSGKGTEATNLVAQRRRPTNRGRRVGAQRDSASGGVRPAGRLAPALGEPPFNPSLTMQPVLRTSVLLTSLALAACGGGGGGGAPVAPRQLFLSQSGMVQISRNEQFVFVLNKICSEALGTGRGSVTIVRVKNAAGVEERTVVTEILVGSDPYSLTATADGKRLLVSNGKDNTVSVIDLGPVGAGPYTRLADILVGGEPRGTAELDGKVYVANFVDGTLTVIDSTTLSRIATIDLSLNGTRIANPYAVTGTPDGKLWVADFFARAIPGKATDAIEGFDDGKEGRVAVIGNNAVQAIVRLAPVADAGFNATRVAFDTANGAANDTFKAPAGVDPAQVPQGAMFNQLGSLAFDEAGKRLYLPTVAAQPAPPVKFDVNVQPLVAVIDGTAQTAVAALHKNLNKLIQDNFANEPAPTPPFTNVTNRLDRAFAADTTAAVIKNRVGAFLSRAGSFLMKAEIAADGVLTLARDARGAILRVPVTNLPGGVAMTADGKRAFVVSELVGQLTVVNLDTGIALGTVDTATTPTDPLRRKELIGQLKFFTGMGIPANVAADTDPRVIDTHRHRNMQSANNWSSCASCHPSGMADTMTWIFATGPRQTLALDAFFARGSTIENNLATTDQKISNWNAERNGSTEFNNNSRGVQGGHGFTLQALATIDAGQGAAAVPDAGTVFNQGQRLGISPALDFETQWIASLRAFNRPTTLDVAKVADGRPLFDATCASCHGGTKWTRSNRIVNNLTRWPDPAFNAAGTSLSARLFVPVATTIAAFDSDSNGSFETPVIDTTVPAVTLDLTNPIELRGAGGAIGRASVGANGSFAIPSLFGNQHTAPYGHHGRAQTLDDVFKPLNAGGLNHPSFGLSPTQLAAVLEFVRAIDEEQQIFP
ncbi:MAG: YncE family protein [Planctomycetes bacterium]|nr:YncE family protein [Planctomycetota bacterium]